MILDEVKQNTLPVQSVKSIYHFDLGPEYRQVITAVIHTKDEDGDLYEDLVQWCNAAMEMDHTGKMRYYLNNLIDDMKLTLSAKCERCHSSH